MNILITGGSSGLGKATVELLASEPQHFIWFTYFPNEQHKDNAAKLCQNSTTVNAIEVNFCDLESVNKLCSIIQEIDLDVLINNVYVGNPKSTHFHKIKSEEFLNSFANNLLPVIKITQAALMVFKKKSYGKIINILTSYLINLPPIGFATYVANKAYLKELSIVWNKEYAKYNISSNCISPEYMQTEFGKPDERIIEQMTMDHPLKKLLTTYEVATVIKFLIDTSQQVNGVNIPINAAQIIL